MRAPDDTVGRFDFQLDNQNQIRYRYRHPPSPTTTTTTTGHQRWAMMAVEICLAFPPSCSAPSSGSSLLFVALLARDPSPERRGLLILDINLESLRTVFSCSLFSFTTL